MGTNHAREFARYDVVIHLRTADPEHGYNHANPLRTEPAAVAAEVDARILDAWRTHRRRFEVPSSMDFSDKVARALTILNSELPA